MSVAQNLEAGVGPGQVLGIGEGTYGAVGYRGACAGDDGLQGDQLEFRVQNLLAIFIKIRLLKACAFLSKALRASPPFVTGRKIRRNSTMIVPYHIGRLKLPRSYSVE